MKIEVSKEILNNLIVFLNRVEIKGINEIQAMNEILDIINKPLIQEHNNAQNNEIKK